MSDIDLEVLHGTAVDCDVNETNTDSDSDADSADDSKDATNDDTNVSTENAIIASCAHLTRFVTAMRYHELLTSSKGRKKGNALFAEFCAEHYPLFLADYIHFMRRHANDAEAIKAEALEKFGLAPCSVSHCKVQRRDSRRRGGDKGKGKADDGCEHFYGDTVANVHFLLHHLRQHGLRTLLNADEQEAVKDDDEDDEIECVDAKFAERAAQIAQSKKQFGTELGDSTKFTIQIESEDEASKQKGKGTRVLLMDELFKHLRAHDDPHSGKVQALLVGEHFDSVSVQIDLDFETGNVASDALRANIGRFVHDFNIGGRSFSTGLAFQYHAFFADEQKANWFQEKQRTDNTHDYGGHTLSSLFVPARFESIKEEVLNSKFLSAAEFEEFIVGKAQRYFESAECKAMKCKERMIDDLHFGIEEDDPLRVEHLHSLLLYTDFSALCTDFSSSFRAVYRGESLESIKARNSRYHHIAKRLKELVMYFGSDKRYEKSVGPFYCGMNIVLNIPQFAIRFNGPTSTSLFIEVAMRFGGVEGMVIELNNDTYFAREERHFECDWISAFPEEAERLFMGGRYPLQLQSVRIVETNHNYQRFLHAFNLFDMLSGNPAMGGYTKKNASIVRGAIDGYLGVKKNGYHQFVNDTFRHFCASKTQIILRLGDIAKYVKSKDFMSLVMNEIKEQNSSDVSDNDVNLFKPVLFELFGNVQEVVLVTVSWRKDYACNLERLSQYAVPTSLRRMVVEGEWLKEAFTDSVKELFIGRGWRVQLDRNKLKLDR